MEATNLPPGGATKVQLSEGWWLAPTGRVRAFPNGSRSKRPTDSPSPQVPIGSSIGQSENSSLRFRRYVNAVNAVVTSRLERIDWPELIFASSRLGEKLKSADVNDDATPAGGASMPPRPFTIRFPAPRGVGLTPTPLLGISRAQPLAIFRDLLEKLRVAEPGRAYSPLPERTRRSFDDRGGRR